MNYKKHKVFFIFYMCSITLLLTGCPKLLNIEDIINSQVSKVQRSRINTNEIVLLISDKTAHQKIITHPTSAAGNMFMWQVPIGKYLSMTSQQYFTQLQGTKTSIITVLPDKLSMNKIILELQVGKFEFGLDRSKFIYNPLNPESEIALKVIRHKINSKPKLLTYNSGKVNVKMEKVFKIDKSGKVNVQMEKAFKTGTDNEIRNKIRESIILAIITSLEQVEKDL